MGGSVPVATPDSVHRLRLRLRLRLRVWVIHTPFSAMG